MATESRHKILDAFMQREHLVDPEAPIQGTPEAIAFHTEWKQKRLDMEAEGYTNVEIFDLWLAAFRRSGLKSQDLLINSPQNTSQKDRYMNADVLAHNSIEELQEVTRAKVQENPFAMITKNDLMIGLRNDQGY